MIPSDYSRITISASRYVALRFGEDSEAVKLLAEIAPTIPLPWVRDYGTGSLQFAASRPCRVVSLKGHDLEFYVVFRNGTVDGFQMIEVGPNSEGMLSETANNMSLRGIKIMLGPVLRYWEEMTGWK